VKLLTTNHLPKDTTVEPINISNDLYRVAIEDGYILIETRKGRPLMTLEGAELRLYDAPRPNQRGPLDYDRFTVTANGVELG
jgi:hypothetical protein